MDPGAISVGRILRETVTLSRSITVLHSAFMRSAVSPGSSSLTERASPPAFVWSQGLLLACVAEFEMVGGAELLENSGGEATVAVDHRCGVADAIRRFI